MADKVERALLRTLESRLGLGLALRLSGITASAGTPVIESGSRPPDGDTELNGSVVIQKSDICFTEIERHSTCS